MMIRSLEKTQFGEAGQWTEAEMRRCCHLVVGIGKLAASQNGDGQGLAALKQTHLCAMQEAKVRLRVLITHCVELITGSCFCSLQYLTAACFLLINRRCFN